MVITGYHNGEWDVEKDVCEIPVGLTVGGFLRLALLVVHGRDVEVEVRMWTSIACPSRIRLGWA